MNARTKTAAPIAPLVHLNGTSAEALLETLRGAASALEHARDSLYATAPNARDYYPIGVGAFERARQEHEARVSAVSEVIAALDSIAADVDAQVAPRAPQRPPLG